MVLGDGSVGRAAVPVGRLDRRPRGGRAARRRQGALRRQGRPDAPSPTSIETIAPAIYGLDAADQAGLDAVLRELDGTPNKATLGRQRDPRRVARRAPTRPQRPTTCRSSATSAGRARRTLPVPMFNILNGGKHAQDSTDFQEFMVMPVGAGHVRRGAAGRRRGLRRAPGDPPRRRPRDRPGRRGRLRAVASRPTRRPSR